MSDFEQLTPRKRQALAALLSQPTREAAARVCGTTPTTLWQYEHKDPVFARALADGRREQLTSATAALSSCSSAAVATLRRICDDCNQTAAARTNAARALLEYALRFSEATAGGDVSTVVFIDDCRQATQTDTEQTEIILGGKP